MIWKAVVIFSLWSNFLLCTPAFAATYFVDYIGGSDSNNGLSTSAAWQHAPGDQRAVGSVLKVLSPGDTLVFKGGVTYQFSSTITDRITAITSGTAASPITYLSGHLFTPSWPNTTNRAVIDGTYADLEYPGYNGIISLVNFDWIIVRGFEIKNWTSSFESEFGAIGWSGATPTAHITIDDNDIHDLQTNGVMLQGQWGPASNPSNIPSGAKIINNKIHRTEGHGLYLRWGWKDVLIEKNFFDLNGDDIFHRNDPNIMADNIDLASDFLSPGSFQENIRILNNVLVDSSTTVGLTPTKSHILVQSDEKNLVVSGNTFKGEPPVSSIDITSRSVDGFFVFNNVFSDHILNFQAPISFYTDFAPSAPAPYNNINIIGNTFVTLPGPGAPGLINFCSGSATSRPVFRNVTVANNILDTDTNSKYVIYIPLAGESQCTTSTSGVIVDMATFNVRNNVYNSGTFLTPFYAEGQRLSFASWKTYLQSKAVSGADNSSAIGAVAFVDRSNEDFHLSAQDNLAKDHGSDASSYYTLDKDGVSRPQGSAWDIGSYELVSGTTLPKPPTNLRTKKGQ